MDERDLFARSQGLGEDGAEVGRGGSAGKVVPGGGQTCLAKPCSTPWSSRTRWGRMRWGIDPAGADEPLAQPFGIRGRGCVPKFPLLVVLRRAFLA